MLEEKYIIKSIMEYALNSKDTRRKVGACIVRSNKIISFGCNNPPSGFENKMTWNLNKDMDNKHLYVVHAEVNAIISSKQDLNNCSLYTTLFPCNECSKLIIQSGIKEVVYMDNPFEHLNEYKASRLMLECCNVKIRRYSYDSENK